MIKNIVITLACIISIPVVIFFIPLVDEFETFNCITDPCESPKITIFESLQKQYSVIDSFEECVSAGNPVMESHPRQCRTTDGKHFVEKINS
ncbi:hypothetical protein AAA799P11_01278 [Marine Group I thaumarchaeote SCGC AAA799-P11]|uniref:Transmembrane protein n=1 Tax=Marine Group I thaumarchaeote SCGC AAA799-P11 TaxID=1502295 RepID=A0A087RWW1_9ARCH|nr:hypothetical protein AAA799P11_01278 [Marine Group I thaumarchaeote SCGC AAA799-P11]